MSKIDNNSNNNSPSVKDRIRLFESLGAKTETTFKIKKVPEQITEEKLENHPSTFDD